MDEVPTDVTATGPDDTTHLVMVQVKIDKPIYRYIWATFPMMELISYFLTNSSVNDTASDNYNGLIGPIWNW